MKKLPVFPEVPADEQTPWVVALLGIMEKLRETIQQQDEEIGRLKDEIALLKGERPVQPSSQAAWNWQQAGSRHRPPLGKRHKSDRVPRSGARRGKSRFIGKSSAHRWRFPRDRSSGARAVCGAGTGAGSVQYAVSGGMLANAGRRVPAWEGADVGGWAGPKVKADVAVPAPSWPHDAAVVEDMLNE